MAIQIIHENGKVETVEGIEGEPTLKQLQEWVGGYIEVVTPSPVEQVVVNEEGMLKGLAPNPFASGKCGTPIVGLVVLLTPPNLMQ